MLSFFTFYSAAISDRLWSLWPALHAVLLEWGIDYWENLLVPLDNMISRGTERFLGSQNPDYLASVYQVRGEGQEEGAVWSLGACRVGG